MHITYIVLSVFAVWRVTHMLGKEDGPFDIFFILRKKAGAGFFGSLLDCFYCISIWIAFPFGIWLGIDWWEKILVWLALSGAACLLEQATNRDKDDQPPKTDYYED